MERFAGRFTLLRPLGRGGMGNVWLAVDRTNGAECALKRLEAHLPRSEQDSLRREFEVLARVRHPSVVSVFELGFAPDGTPFYTMEYIPGVAADKAVGPGEWTAFYACAAQLAHALEVLHAAGVVHGDVKPPNVLVVRGAHRDAPLAEVRLVDLGLAALLGRDRQGHRGTLGYAAPEVVAGAPISIASDLFGLGATLYVLALGCARGAAEAPRVAVKPPQARTDLTLALEEASVPAPLARLVLRLLSADPAARPADAREVRRELEHLHPAAKRSLKARLRTAVLVGRQHELARLERWLAIAPDGPPMLLLSGEPGLGRSAVLGELAVRASLAKHEVVSLSSAESEPGSAIRPLLRRLALEGAAGAAQDAPRAALLARLEGTAALGPELHEFDQAALEWAAAAERSGRAPLVLIDDADRLDSLSRAWVRRLALHPAGGVLRWVLSLPSAGGRVSDDARLLLESGHAEHLALGPLERDAADALLRARLHGSSPPELAEAVWKRAGGHPGLVIETLHAAAESGALVDGESGITIDRDRLEQLSLPADFEQACLARLASLGPEANAAAAALAVWGGPLAPSSLLTMEPRATSEALASLEDSGLLARDEPGRCTLRPPGLVRSVGQALGADERAALHRAALRIGGLGAAQRFAHLAGAGESVAALVEAEEALAEGAGAELAIEAAAVAARLSVEVAVAWEERAGRMLLDRGRYREAIPHLVRALECAPDDPARARRWHALSGAYLRTGLRAELDQLLAMALATPLAERERALLLTNEAVRRSTAGDAAGAEQAASEALALAERSGDGEAESLAAITLGNMQCLQGRMVEAVELGARAEAAGTRAGYALGRIRGTGLRALVAAMQREPAEAERLYRTSLAEARERNARLAELELSANLAWLLLETGRWSEAREMQAESLRVALEEGWPGAVSHGLVNLALTGALTGRVARVVRQAKVALRMVRRHERSFEAYAWRTLATALRVSGRPGAALRAARRALQVAESASPSHDLAWCRFEYGVACSHLGRWSEAGHVWERGLAECASDRLPAPILAALSGRAAVRAGRFDEAAARLAEAEAWLANRRSPYAAAHVQQLHAELELALGRAEDGSRAATGALAGFAALPAAQDAPVAALEFARVATRAGIAGRTPVAEWLRAAASGFERLGDHHHRERALALAVDWHRRHTGSGPGVARDRDLLESVTRLLDSQPDLDELSRRAMQLAVDQLDAERGVLVLVDDASGEPRPVVEHGAVDAATRDQALSYSREVVARVARSGGSLLVGDLTTEPEALSHSMVELGLRSILCVPMFVSGKVVGAVYLDDSRRAEAFGDAERGLLEGFAHLLGVAIENSRGHERVRRANEQLVGENLSLRREVSHRFRPQNFISGSQSMQRILAMVERAAAVPSTVLITGENGTGKELIARLLHYSGPRALKPFVAVNCGAITPTLIESELFGILADVATGVKARAGRFVEAHGGTLFLDEIGDMPLAQQVALLSVLANRKVTPVGGGRSVDVDVRVIAATNRDLAKRIAEGSFREDLWYRLNVVPIEMPALRERKADIPALAQHFVAMFAAQQGRDLPELSPGLLAVLMQSDWAGNVRELQNYIERLMAMNPGRVLHPKPLPHDLQQRALARPHPERARPLGEMVAELEKRHLLEALERHAGNQSRAARELGMTEQSLRYRLRKYTLARARRFQRFR